MAHEPEQKPSIRFDLVIAAATLVLAVLAYVRPPDPAHPMRFDWLSRTVSMPLWLAAVISLGIMAITVVFVRARVTRFGGRKKAPDIPECSSLPEIRTQSDSQKESKEQKIQTSQIELPPRLENGKGRGDESFIVSSAEGYSVEVQKHRWEQTRGLVLQIMNQRLSWIARYRITVRTAQSFDASHKDYRDGVGFKAVFIQRNEPIEASGRNSPIWLIRNDGKSDLLFVGEDNSSPLRWPVNDKSREQKWKLSLSIDAESLGTSGVPSRPLLPIAMETNCPPQQ